MIQPLERRLLLAVQTTISNGVLNIVGTSVNDNIVITSLLTQSGSRHKLGVFTKLVQKQYTEANAALTFYADTLTKVNADLGAGNDVFKINSGIHSTANASVLGGSGNDNIQDVRPAQTGYFDGGDGDDVLQGVTTIIGGLGNDVLNGSSALDNSYLTEVLIGGAGDDQIDARGGRDSIEGGDGNDRIAALGSIQTFLDTINAGAGNDEVTTYQPANVSLGAGNDVFEFFGIYGLVYGTAYGDSGRDRMRYDSEDPLPAGKSVKMYGGADSDTLTGGVASVSLYGEAGDDLLNSTDGNDYLDGGTGSDTIEGASGNDTIAANDGVMDYIGQPNGTDTVSKDALDKLIAPVQVTFINGQLKVIGSENSDRLDFKVVTNPNTGVQSMQIVRYRPRNIYSNDVPTVIGTYPLNAITSLNVEGRGGDDIFRVETLLGNRPQPIPATLTGGLGNDVIGIGLDDILGTRLIDGGVGDDSLGGGTTILGGDGNDDINGIEERNYRKFSGIFLLSGGAGNDSIDGAGAADNIEGGDGDDAIYVRWGFGIVNNTTINAGNGNDRVDIVKGTNGTTTVNLGAGDDKTYVNDYISDGQTIKVYGQTGNDFIKVLRSGDVTTKLGNLITFDGGDGNDTLIGGAEDDTLLGQAGRDLIYGDLGNDSINGGADNDTLYGGDGTDKIYGGSGDDSLIGDKGKDSLYGELGIDTLIANDGVAETLSGGVGADVYTKDAIDTILD